MPRTLQNLKEPFVPGDTWKITNHFNDKCTRHLYADAGMDGHDGIDWGCPTGTPIYAMAAGTVDDIVVGESTGAWDETPELAYGNYVRIVSTDAQGSYSLTYGHLAVVLVRKGATVRQGALIGVSGNTGYSTGPHLHVRYRPRPYYDYDNGFYGAEDFAHLMDPADKASRVERPSNRKLYV